MKFDVAEPLGVAYNLRLKPTTGVPYSQSGFNLQEIFLGVSPRFHGGDLPSSNVDPKPINT